MKRTGFNDVLSLSERPVYDGFVIGSDDNMPLHLYVMLAALLITDARARNKVFDEVLRLNMNQEPPASTAP